MRFGEAKPHELASPRTRFILDARYMRLRPSGVGSYVEALVDRLPQLAPEAAFRFWTHPEVPSPSCANNVSHHTVHDLADGFRTWAAPGRLDRLRDHDVVHFPFSILGRGLRCATVVTIHDLMWLEHAALVDARPLLWRVRRPYYALGMQRAMKRATRLIAVSNATADRILAHHPNAGKRLVVTHNAVSSEFSPAVDDASERRVHELLGSDEPYFLVVGKNEPYKAHDVAVKAFARVARTGERLVMVQRENRGRALGSLVRELGIHAQVTWMPSLTRPDLVHLLRQARALIQPSVVEGFGIPVVEAMACGCPVVASDTPALVEVLAGAGLHGGVGVVDDFARALVRLREAGLREELRARGLERAACFSWDRTARATLDVYQDAARASGR